MELLIVASTLLSPAIAVTITLWWQRRKERRDAKERLFVALMAHRRVLPPTQQWVENLNLIDIVFADEPKVLELWHKYYEQLAVPPTNNNYEVREHTYLLLLSSMAKSLGYRRLEQTDIDKFYLPVAHGKQWDLNTRCQEEWLRVLQNTACFNVSPRDMDQVGPNSCD